MELRDETGALLLNTLKLFFIELPKIFEPMNKEVLSSLDQWMLAIKTMHTSDEIPDWITDENVKQAYQRMEIASLTPEQRESYERDLRNKRDVYSTLKTHRDLGREEGEEVGKAARTAQIILRMHAEGYPLQQIEKITEEPLAKIEAILKAN